jgi:signal transducing adaptor molecule
VEILKDATPEELMREAEEESKILAEGRNIEKLLGLLANAEGGRGVEDEDLQGLYNSTLAIRPKLVKLIEKYSMRKGSSYVATLANFVDELIALNEKFHKARHDYDVLMESSMSRYSRPAPAPSTNPFGQGQPYAASFQQPTQRPLSGTGYPPNPIASPPPPGPGYPQGSPISSFPPTANNWETYPQAKPWENAQPPTQVQAPQPQSNPWETQQQPTTNTSVQWDSQFQPQWDQERPAPPSTYQGPAPNQPPQHYGGGLDELTGQPPDQQQQYQHWYEPPSNPPPGNNPALSTSSPIPPANTGTAAFPPQSTTTAAPPHPYFSAPPSLNPSNPELNPESRHQHTYSQSSDPSSYALPPPSQAPPAIPFEQKPQSNPPYPTGKGSQPFYSTAPKPPATYTPQGQGDKYASLRSLSPANQESSGPGGWYSSSGSQEQKEAGKPPADAVHNSGGGPGYYGVGT